MERQRNAKSLFVLTLLQLCRAEIKDTQPQWYSANVINDVFQPKPISEIFSPESPFSTANPIIVSSQGNDIYSEEDIILSSTFAPPTSLSSTTSPDFTSQSTFPPSSQTTPSTVQQQYTPTQQTLPQLIQSSVEIPQQTSKSDLELRPQLVTEAPPQPQRNVQIQLDQFTSQTFLPSSAVTEASTFYQSPWTELTPTGEIGFKYPETQPPQRPQPTSMPGFLHNAPNQPNYFLIYQQAPQSYRSFPNPASSPQTPIRESVTTSTPPLTSSIPSTLSSSFSTFSSSSIPTTLRSSPLLDPVTSTPITPHSPTSTISSPRVTVTSMSTIGSISSISKISRQDCFKSTTHMPHSISSKPPGLIFPLKIRVSAPSGSITNVHINPMSKTPSTTTRRPTTRRTPKPKKNTYDRCIHGCRKHGQSLCAAPLGQNPINPKDLRGFPSVCHMACHNSFRHNPYETIIDGSCSKLRTRIRPVDSHTKLKKDELHKVEYFLHTQDKPTIEIDGVYS